MADKLPRKTEKPWGYELLYALTSHYAGKVIFVKKGERLSLQYHRKKEETIYIYQGRLRVEIEGKNNEMFSYTAHPGENIHIPPQTKHRMEAVEDTTLLEVSTPELEDVVRLDDDYGRAESKTD